VAEWFKAPVLKTGEGASLPWVRIPPRPPESRKNPYFTGIFANRSLAPTILPTTQQLLGSRLDAKDHSAAAGSIATPSACRSAGDLAASAVAITSASLCAAGQNETWSAGTGGFGADPPFDAE
jgi:hypothetical protein